MALTDTQRQQLVQAKSKGLTKEQAMARVFNKPQTARSEGRFADVGEDITSAVTGLGRDFMQRGDTIREGFAAGSRGEQTPIETGAQLAGNVLGAAGDIAFRGAQAVVTPFMKESEERAVESAVGEAVEATGIPQAVSEMSPRGQRNVTGALGLFEGATAGIGGAAVRPASRGISDRIGSIFRRPSQDVAEPTPAPKTPEQVVDQAQRTLRQQANDETLSPRAREEAANAALTFKERYIGLTPDVKSRLGQMGPTKLQEYLDAAHIRNIDDSKPTPYEVGAQNVNDTLSRLDERLRNTGSDIGQAREKLSTIKAPIDSVRRVENTFASELDKLNLVVRNGEIQQKPGTVSKTDAAGDIRALQSLYNDMQVFKQSPTLKNAIDLRMAFDGKVKFGKSARDVSNSVDPVSRSVRAALAQEAAKVVGKTNAAELQRYSEFMEAYGDLKSFTDRAAGGEYLLRLVLSGRGGDARQLIDTVKQYTGTDLMNDATAMKVATETLGNENTRNLFRQEVTSAGYDAAALASGSPVGIASVFGRKLLERGIDAEDVLKKAASGGAVGTGAYLLMENNPEFAPAIGFAVGSITPTGRREIVSRVAKLADSNTVDEMFDFNRVIKEGGVATNNKGELKFNPIEGMSETRVRRAYEDGLRLIEMDAETFNTMGNTSPGNLAKFYEDVIAETDLSQPGSQ